MSELHYAFIKNNRVMDILVFASRDDDFADLVAHEKGYDDSVWVGENVPYKYSSYDPDTKIFTGPTLDDLYELGISDENQAMYDARMAAFLAQEDPTNPHN